MRLIFTILLVFLSFGIFAQSSLVLHYPINQTTVSSVHYKIYDQSPYGNDANIFGPIYYDADSFGGYNQAIMTGFYSSNHRYFTVDTPLDFGGNISDFTFTFWALQLGTNQQSGIADMFYFKNEDGDEFYIGMDKGNYSMILQIRQNGQVLYDNSNVLEITLNLWQHIAISYDQGAEQLKIYINGNIEKEISLDFNFPVNPTLEIAVKEGVPMDGIVICYDEIRLYNQYLTEEDIAIVLQNSTNVERWLESNEITMFPNPAKSSDRVKINSISNAQVKILDAKGQLIKSTALNNGELDLTDLAVGTYFIQLFNNDQSVIKKLLIQP